MSLDQHQVSDYPENQTADLDQNLGREPTYQESSTSKSPLNQLLDQIDESLAHPPRERAESFQKAHTTALSANTEFLKKKAQAKAEADAAAKSPDGLEYAERLQEINKPVSRFDSIMAKVRQEVRLEPRPQCMDYYEAKKIVAELLIIRLARENKKLFFTPEQKEVIADITAYFIGDPGSSIPLTKGIFLYGGVGVGKSFIMQTMAKFCELAEIKPMLFKEISTKSLMQEVADEGKVRPIRKYFTGNVMLDDLGEERQDVKLYGNTENPMDLLITERYTRFQEKGMITHATSNLPPNKLSIYGTRLFDRFGDMTHAVLLPGGSKRG